MKSADEIVRVLSTPANVKAIKQAGIAVRKKRWKEPSTWASIAAACGVLTAIFPAASVVAGPLAAISAAAGVWLQEG